ncbi:putative peroxiredoxin bcp [Clostridium oryzae]|uniref:Bacterioferritin comigratory protein n=1 Tax=Clostridium oryzae TaxID=1450648 RepID=A0A1V4I6K2_9CLOT|nr:putative peroxiredoxin bcp [Clostridium oryzae]
MENFKNLNAVVISISRDTLKSHESFIIKQNISFLLLSDIDETVCKLYDVLEEKNMYGKKSIGIERSTFVIDKDGKFTKIFRKVHVTAHIDCLLEVLKTIKD